MGVGDICGCDRYECVGDRESWYAERYPQVYEALNSCVGYLSRLSANPHFKEFWNDEDNANLEAARKALKEKAANAPS